MLLNERQQEVTVSGGAFAALLAELFERKQLHAPTFLNIRPDGACGQFCEMFLGHILKKAAIIAIVPLEDMLVFFTRQNLADVAF